VVFLFAWAVVISLACNLSCSGNEAAAAFVGIAGTLILLILLILVMRRIWSKKFNQPDPQPAPAAPSE
jgi:nitrate reductase gamma subunit